MRSFVLSVLVYNNFGVLTRISGLFSRRGYNIESLTVGATMDSGISKMTIECVGDDYTLAQIKSQLGKVEDVISVTELLPENSIYRELFLVRVSASPESLSNALLPQNCRILSQNSTETVYELCGLKTDFYSFCGELEKCGKIDIARTGITAIEK